MSGALLFSLPGCKARAPGNTAAARATRSSKDRVLRRVTGTRLQGPSLAGLGRRARGPMAGAGAIHELGRLICGHGCDLCAAAHWHRARAAARQHRKAGSAKCRRAHPVDGNRRCRSGYAGVHIQTSRKSGRGPAQTRMRRPARRVTAQGRLRYGRELVGLPGSGLNRRGTCQP